MHVVAFYLTIKIETYQIIILIVHAMNYCLLVYVIIMYIVAGCLNKWTVAN